MIITRQAIMRQVAGDKRYQTGVKWYHAGVRCQVVAWWISLSYISIRENSTDTEDRYEYKKRYWYRRSVRI